MPMADRLLAGGKPAEAQRKYQEILKANPGSIPATVGLIRSLLLQQNFDEANAAADSAVAQRPNSPELQLALGDLQFAEGKIPDAERSYVKAENLRPDDAAAHIALARVYRAASLYRRAYDNLKRAHELAPNNVLVQMEWFAALPQSERVPAVEAYLKTPDLNPQVGRVLTGYLGALKRAADAPDHPCKLVSDVKRTDVKLYPIAKGDAALGASGLAVKINGQEMHLAMDTGASGVLLGRTSAEKLNLPKLGYRPIFGIGESGQQGGYEAVAKRIRIGDLEFEDCTVRVTDKATPVTGQDGLLGTDVLAAYLIDIDIPGARLRLSPLPKRPDEAPAPTSLKTNARDSRELETEEITTKAANLPKDAYVAPEMSNWSKVYRFRNLLLVPTKVDNTGPMLFLIDTGSFANVLSKQTGQRLTQLRSDPSTHVSGLSGTVKEVYRADKATLQFGRYEQANQDVVTFDLSNISRQTGTQVSGVLGFNMLRILQIKIDYRDGLVDFLFDPKHLPKGMKLDHQD
jgi:tetratricopeptide (TPR) repeat protein